jgi:hypothetical protein
MKRPSFQFYPADWRKDPGVQSLSYHDRGVWFEIICLLHESEERGKLLLNGKPMPEDALARLLGLDKQKLNQTLSILIEFGVAQRCEETGALMNRRMVRDETLSRIRAESGKMGGNPFLLNQKSKQKPTTPLIQIPTPSSSSSSSTSVNEDKRTPPRPKPSKPTIEEVMAFAESLGLPASDGEATYYKWEGNGWKNGSNPVKDWKATIRSWKAGGFLPSQKNGTSAGAKSHRKNEYPQETLQLPD